MGKSKYIAKEEHKKLCERIAPQKGDILLCRIGTLGKAIKVYWDFEFSIFVSLGVLRPILSEIADYIASYINSPIGFRWIQSVKVGGGTHTYKINLNDIPQMLICIPPLEEQYRISNELNLLNDIVIHYGRLQERLDELSGSLNVALKKSILQEAIQGKLTSQDPTDEPASVLLDRIRVEKEKLLKVGKIKKKDIVDSVIYKGEDNKYYEKVDGKILDISEEISFEIPNSWQWIRLGTLFSHNTGKALNRADTDGIKKKYLTTSNVYWNRFDFNEVREMFFTDPELEKCTVHKGDLLVCEGGDIGRSAIWQYDEEICIQNHIHRLRAYYPINTEFYYLVFYHYKNIGNIGGKGIGIQGLSSGALHRLIVPLPPIEEQYRITHKYNTLIASTMRK